MPQKFWHKSHPMGLPHSFCLAIFSSAKTLPPAKNGTEHTHPSSLMFVAVPWLFISPIYFIIGGRKNKAFSQSRACLYLCYVKQRWTSAAGCLVEGASPFSLANQHQGWEGSREGEASRPSGPTLLAVAFPFLSLNCKMGNSHTRFVPFTNEEGAGTDLFT